MIYFNRAEGKSCPTEEALEQLAAQKDYQALVDAARLHISDLPDPSHDPQQAAARYETESLCPLCWQYP